MKRHVLALIFVVPFLTGCSSILGIGHENFRCEGTDKGEFVHLLTRFIRIDICLEIRRIQ